MSLFDSMMSNAAETLLQATGTDKVIYRPMDADPVTLTAIVGVIQDLEQPESDRGIETKRTRSVTIRRDSTAPGGGISDPQLQEQIEIDGETWSIEAIESQSVTWTSLRAVFFGKTQDARRGLDGG